MAEHTGVFTWVISKIKGGKIISKSIISYIVNPLTGSNYQLNDLAGNDLVTKNILVGTINTPPVTLPFNTGNFPYSIANFSITYANFFPTPTIIIREFYNDVVTTNASIKQRSPEIGIYDTVTDVFTIDAPPFDGDITFKV